MSVTEREFIAAQRQMSKWWWLFLVTGIIWMLFGFVVLSLDAGTPRLIGYLAGFVLVFAGVTELVELGFVEAWKWLHGLLGVLFVIAGIMALTSPFQTFGILALLIGWYLLFKGMADIVISIIERDVVPLWGLTLALGIVEVIVGVWAVGYPGRSAWLLVLWVGVAALTRGITEIVLAFKLRGTRPTVALT
jgi:uncharacterized membrane protein HdeD (DUF308 family)